MKKRWMLLMLLVGVITGGMICTRMLRAQAEPKRIEISAHRFEYQPAEITVKKGEPVVLVIKSLDVAHGLRFRDLGIDAKVDKGSSTEVKFTADKTGDFVGHCSVFCGSGHGGMALTIHVTE